jgi:hypothetical protein
VVEAVEVTKVVGLRVPVSKEVIVDPGSVAGFEIIKKVRGKQKNNRSK